MREMSAPHIRSKKNAPQIYLDVVIALLPCCVAAIYAYGIRAVILLLWGAFLHALTDHIFSRFVRREQVYLDLSGLISGLILVLLLPPTVSLWAVAAGVLFSSVVVKQFFGGVGSNLFNPALAGRAFLAVAFSETTNTLARPFADRWSLITLITGPRDAVSAVIGQPDWLEILSGLFPGAMGLTSAVFAAAGGVYLLYRGILKLHAPLSYMITLIAGYWIFFLNGASVSGMLSLLFTSGVVFCAAFALGDFSTVPTSGPGRIAFGIGTGIWTLMMLASGQSNLAIVFSVLLMNGVTPVLEFYIRPRIFAQQPWYFQKGAAVNEQESKADPTDDKERETEVSV
ncbi:MAG: RnfABCDGE type electron transport complex subunit D [Clostridiales bacterium]|nr:RnfABCDGE type electron transport complex subunit D [Clostridiales bacterium]